MKHRLFTIISALSLLLSLTIGTLWARSYWWQDSVGWFASQLFERHTPDIQVTSNEGRIILRWFSDADVWKSGHWRLASFHAEPDFDPRDKSLRERFVAYYEYDSGATPPLFSASPLLSVSTVAIHDFWLVVLTLLLPVGSFVRRAKQRQRLREGLCLTCGYDLRASIERCPECGTPIPLKAVGGSGRA